MQSASRIKGVVYGWVNTPAATPAAVGVQHASGAVAVVVVVEEEKICLLWMGCGAESLPAKFFQFFGFGIGEGSQFCYVS